MDLASPAVSGTSVYANGLIIKKESYKKELFSPAGTSDGGQTILIVAYINVHIQNYICCPSL